MAKRNDFDGYIDNYERMDHKERQRFLDGIEPKDIVLEDVFGYQPCHSCELHPFIISAEFTGKVVERLESDLDKGIPHPDYLWYIASLTGFSKVPLGFKTLVRRTVFHCWDSELSAEDMNHL